MNRSSVVSINILLAVLLATGGFATAHDQAGAGASPTHDGQVSGMSRAATGNSSTAAITIDNFSFAPTTLTVTAGTKVTWTNHDDVPHTVVSTDQGEKFRSRALDTDESYSFTFTQPGTYAYFCSVHPRMTATVVVTARN
jgi:plastocyanin